MTQNILPYLLVLSLFIPAICLSSETWWLEDGRTIKAELADYNPDDGKVELTRDSDGKRIKVPLDEFCEEDQQEIRDRTSGDMSWSVLKAIGDAGIVILLFVMLFMFALVFVSKATAVFLLAERTGFWGGVFRASAATLIEGIMFFGTTWAVSTVGDLVSSSAYMWIPGALLYTATASLIIRGVYRSSYCRSLYIWFMSNILAVVVGAVLLGILHVIGMITGS